MQHEFQKALYIFQIIIDDWKLLLSNCSYLGVLTDYSKPHFRGKYYQKYDGKIKVPICRIGPANDLALCSVNSKGRHVSRLYNYL